MLRFATVEVRGELPKTSTLQRKEVKTMDAKHSSLLDRLFESVPETPQSELGHYDTSTQTWSHRDARLMSPVKHNQEA